MARRSSFLNFEILGAAQLEANLRALGANSVIRRVMKSALLEAAQPMVNTAKSLARRNPASVGHPHMADKIAASTTLSRRQRAQARRAAANGLNTTEVFVGAGAKGPAVLAEFGTGVRTTRGRGRKRRIIANRGIMPAFPFMRPAWEQHKTQILDDFAKALGAAIEREAAKIGRRNARAARRAARGVGVGVR